MPGQKKPFIPPAEVPACVGAEVIRYDFQQGFRLSIDKKSLQAPVHLFAWDSFTGTTLADQDIGDDPAIPDFRAVSEKKYFIPFNFEIRSQNNVVFKHEFNLTDKKVLIILPEGTIGDTIAWMSAIELFSKKHKCNLVVRLAPEVLPLFQSSSLFKLVGDDKDIDVSDVYATYYIGLFLEDTSRNWNPYDYRTTPLLHIPYHILGLSVPEKILPPQLTEISEQRPIPEKYVCISAQATCAAKMWMNPYGWTQLISKIKEKGYRVICIDKSLACGDGISWNFMPPGAEDQTGDRPLLERAHWIKHCSFFVGLSSGLSWLAWALRKEVVLISGFTSPTTEFWTPYRVMNKHACNSCWNRHYFDNMDFLWCPDHKNTKRHFECTLSITAHQVLQFIEQIPSYGKE